MGRSERTRGALLALLAPLALVACGTSAAGPDVDPDRASTTVQPPASVADPASTSPPTTSSTPTSDDEPVVASPARPRPDWLGTRVLPTAPNGFGEIQPTPPELVDRRLQTPDHLPPPASADFAVEVEAVPDDVLARSTWSPECPVPADDLRWVRLTFWGFDEQVHTGELLVHADAVDVVVGGFALLHERRFPIEEMRIVVPAELDAPPTGDGNNTTAFVCRPVRGATSWSEHAYGRAVDINPFHNPYVKGDVVLPELASSYIDRTDHRPGMLTADAVAAFTSAGWGWGGSWQSLQDHMHLSATGR